MEFINKLAEVVKQMDPDKLFNMYKDPNLNENDLGQLFIVYATLINPQVAKVFLNVPAIPKYFPEKAKNACYGLIETRKMNVNKKIMAEGGQEDYPLQLAATMGSPELVEFLLKKGANPNIKIDGYPLIISILSFASEQLLPLIYEMAFKLNNVENITEIADNYKKILKLLINYGADTTVMDPNLKQDFVTLAEQYGLSDIANLARKKQGLA